MSLWSYSYAVVAKVLIGSNEKPTAAPAVILEGFSGSISSFLSDLDKKSGKLSVFQSNSKTVYRLWRNYLMLSSFVK
ncbi:hypothetical protein NPIL_115311 [Nephila pilipes]|uniref:Uncharacterized protein n=1 Tax=Nephila pilipes TaxID=299642 RepID=A0A8X6TXH7_NEPPI|nr:hypothetical protein NPIL_115311 [Nephila pilipes]